VWLGLSNKAAELEKERAGAIPPFLCLPAQNEAKAMVGKSGSLFPYA
jgi:hypothetical protein